MSGGSSQVAVASLKDQEAEITARLSRWIETPIEGRLRASVTAAPILAVTAIVPYMPSTQLAVVGICISFFGCMMTVINLHVIPIDLFGPKHAAFSTALLTASFALVQVFLSPAIGVIVDHSSFAAVCALVSALSLAGIALVRLSIKP